MGSGCKQNYREDNCTDPVSDKCVFYTGEPIEVFGICTGDTLQEIEQVIIDRLLLHMVGLGISLPDITFDCPFVQDILANQDPTLYNLIQGLFTSACSLRQLIQTIQDGLEPPFAFDVSCLTVPVDATRNQIIQATITKVCEVEAKVNEIIADLSTEDPDETNNILNAVYNVVGNMLATNINSCQDNIVKTGSGQNTQLNFVGGNPIGTLLFGMYNISSFDNTGLGIASAGMCGWAIANGSNGTVDMRGFTPSGATNIPGGTLNSLVQPNGDNDLVTNINQTKGQYKITLSSSQLPAHQHVVTQTPHSHSYTKFVTGGGAGEAFPTEGVDQGGSVKFYVPQDVTSSNNANITVGGLQGTSGQPHENRPPTRYGMFIQRIS